MQLHYAIICIVLAVNTLQIKLSTQSTERRQTKRTRPFTFVTSFHPKTVISSVCLSPVVGVWASVRVYLCVYVCMFVFESAPHGDGRGDGRPISHHQYGRPSVA